MLFRSSDRIERFIPPKKGRSHVLTIIKELIGLTPESRGTDIGEGLRFLTNVLKKRSTAFVLSDFMDTQEGKARFEEAMKIASGKHDLVGIRVWDRREAEMPDVGIVELRDAETGEKVWTDTSSRRVREHYAEEWKRNDELIERTLMRSRVDNVKIATGEDYVSSLMQLFKRR